MNKEGRAFKRREGGALTKPILPDEEQFLDVHETADFLKCSEVTVYRKYVEDPDLQPDGFLAGKRVWRLSRLKAWRNKALARPSEFSRVKNLLRTAAP